jgi:hypothetical protein
MNNTDAIETAMRSLKESAINSSKETFGDVSSDFCYGYTMSAVEILLNDLSLTKKQMAILSKRFGVQQ